jgi:hypothetical protein
MLYRGYSNLTCLSLRVDTALLWNITYSFSPHYSFHSSLYHLGNIRHSAMKWHPSVCTAISRYTETRLGLLGLIHCEDFGLLFTVFISFIGRGVYMYLLYIIFQFLYIHMLSGLDQSAHGNGHAEIPVNMRKHSPSHRTSGYVKALSCH